MATNETPLNSEENADSSNDPNEISNYLTIIKKKTNHFDLESLAIAMTLLFLARIISVFSPYLLNALISALIGVVVIFFSIFKLLKWIIYRLDKKIDFYAILALTPINAVLTIFILWLSIASISQFAPVVVAIFLSICLLLPKKSNISKKLAIEISRFIKITKNSSVSLAILLMQVGAMSLGSYSLLSAESSFWLEDVFSGSSPIIYITIFIVIIANLLLSQRNRRIWIVSTILAAFWMRSFLLLRGFVHFGGDDGEHAAVTSYLLNGGIAPLIDINIFNDGSSWRYGSILSLCFHSNQALICTLTGLTPAASAGALAIALNTSILLISTFSLSNIILRKEETINLATSLIVIAGVSDFMWNLRFDPNGLLHVLFVSYLCIAIIMPKTKWGITVFIISTLTMIIVHPTGIALVVPSLILWSSSILKENNAGWITKNLVKSIAIFCILLLLIIIILINPIIIESIARLISIINISTIIDNIQVGFYPEKSELWGPVGTRFELIFYFSGILTILGLILWKNTKDVISNRFNAALFISFLFILELIILDVFTIAPYIVLYWRLLGLIPVVLMPIAAALLTTSQYEWSIPINRRYAKVSSNTLLAFSLSIIISFSFIGGAYSSNGELSLNVLSVEEFELMAVLADRSDQNSSIVTAEYPVIRYYRAIVGDWPPRSPTFNYTQSGDWFLRWHAFEDLAYRGKTSTAIKLIENENINAIYAIVLNRYSFSKSIEWHNGSMYVSQLPLFGSIFYSNSAGYVLKLSREDYREIAVTLTNWSVQSFGVENPSVDIVQSNLRIMGNFTNHYQAIRLEKPIESIQTSEFTSFHINYTSNYPSGGPHIRILLGESLDYFVELEPKIEMKRSYVELEYSLTELPIESISYIVLQMDSGSEQDDWNGPGVYRHLISEMYFSSWIMN